MMALSNAGIIQNTTTTTIFGSGSTPPTHSHTENISRSGDLLTLIRHSDTFAYTPMVAITYTVAIWAQAAKSCR